MDCEQALLLISAQMDRELDAADQVRLAAHLRECEICRSAAEAFRIQDTDLRQTYAGCQRSGTAVVSGVISQLAATPSPVHGHSSRLPTVEELNVLRRRLGWAMAASVLAAGFFLGWHAWRHRSPAPVEIIARMTPDASTHAPYLTPRPRPTLPATKPTSIGESIQTASGERRRITLLDGSVLYLNQNTKIKVEANRQVTLDAGEVFVDVAPREAMDGQATFVVQTKNRAVSAWGTKFAVRADNVGTGVVVTQGKVQVSDLNDLIYAGQQLAPDSKQLTPAPRASHVLGWTKELMAAIDSPLVPGSKYEGGALIAVDPNGQEAKLNLRKFHIDVHIEDGFARTTIDQTYFNQNPWRMEGTFYFPLPPDASLSRLAMYVSDGQVCKLMEGGMAERDYARNVYEQIVYSQKDPALLEWVDGSTFKMRVFPLEGRQEKRIILSYTQRLPSLYGRTSYRFPAGHNLDVVRDWSFQARVKGGTNLGWSCDSHGLKAIKEGKDLVLLASMQAIKLDRDISLDLYETVGSDLASDGLRYSAAEHEGSRYLMLRYRPNLPTQAERQRRDWVFLFESSGERDPLLARVQIDVIRTLLANAEHDDTFAVLTAGTNVHALTSEPQPVTPENVQAALSSLEKTHLIGALDLGKAFSAAAPLLQTGANPYLVHVGSGLIALGERREQELLQRLAEGTRYVGVGVGKRWNRHFMKLAAEQTGGYFTQINPDEPISWRAFELFATLNTPRLLDIQLKDPAERVVFLNFANTLAQGEELCAITRLSREQPELPATVRITGRLNGETFVRELPVSDGVPGADYLPRTWAKLEIDRLLTDNAREHRAQIISLSKAMYVMTPFTSLLALENEEMYEQFKVDRGRKDHWAMYPCPNQVPIVYEPDPSMPVDVRNAPKDRKPAANQVLQTIVRHEPGRFLNWPNGNGRPESASAGSLGFHPAARALVVRRSVQLGKAAGLPEGRFYGMVDWDALSVDDPIGVETLGVNGIDLNSLKLPALPVDGTVILPRFGHAPDFSVYDTFLRYGGKVDTGLMGGLIRDRSEEVRGSKLQNEWWFYDQIMQNEQRRNRATTLFFDEDRKLDLWSNAPLAIDFRVIKASEADFVASERTREEAPRILRANEFGMIDLTPGPDRLFRLEAEKTLRTWMINESSFRIQNPIEKLNKEPAKLALESCYRDQIAADFVRVLLNGRLGGPQLYGRPSFTQDERLFTDLASYATGLNTSPADIQAILEAEAAPELRNLPGHIDPEARRLIDQARMAGWQTLIIPGEKGANDVRFHFDGRGRYVYERILPLGLKEEVICDGTTLLHLYRELGIGARRSVSRFHRADIQRLIPWSLPPVEDLARGADVTRSGERAVTIVPRDAVNAKDDDGKPIPYLGIRLFFAPDGRLTERRMVVLPADKTLIRETYEPHGVIQWFDAKDKEIAKHEFKLNRALEPRSTPDTAQLVVLPVPLRTRAHVYQKFDLVPNQSLDVGQNACYEYLERHDALELFAAEFAERDSERARQVYQKCFAEKGVRLLGFYTLLASCGLAASSELDFHALRAEHPREPLAEFLTLHQNAVYAGVQQKWGLNLGGRIGPEGSFLQNLADFRDLCLRWRNYNEDLGLVGAARFQAEQAHALAFVRRHQSSILGWAVVCMLQDWSSHSRTVDRAALADTWRLLGEGTGLAVTARYEQARNLLAAGKRADARWRFRELYEQAIQDGMLLPIDANFRNALQSDGTDADLWSELMQKTATDLIAKKLLPAAVSIAWQCWQLGDQPLADRLLSAALDRITDDAERLPTTLAAVAYLWQTSQYVRADDLMQRLSANEKFARLSALQRLAARIAEQRGMTLRAIAHFERALDIEYQRLPNVINLQAVRADYGKLLDHYQWLANAVTTLKMVEPADLRTRVVRATDRWRALDRESSAPCDKAATILKTLGARQLAWEYLTTPIGMKPGESDPWLGLARSLSREGETEMANLAFAAAFESEPTNPQLLWDQAENLRQAGKLSEAQNVLRRIADGQWQPRFNWLQTQARAQLTGR